MIASRRARRDNDRVQPTVRTAELADAAAAAALLHDFNIEFATPTPGAAVLEQRLLAMLERDDVIVLLAQDPPAALALVTFRPSVWDAGPVALLEELYVRPSLRSRGIGGALLECAVSLARDRGTETFEINVDEGDVDAQRFYVAHGFADTGPDQPERAFYYYRRLDPSGSR
jgi:GNAT superfamily N-acetyltransferase